MAWLKRAVRQAGAHPYRTLTLLFVFCLGVFVATIPLPRVDGMLIGSDGIGYYMYVRSLVMDGDLDFANEYEQLRPGMDVSALTTPTGLTGNQFAIGPGLLWSPFFVLGHLVVLALGWIGMPVSADGYGYVYQAAICLGSMGYGFLGILLIHQTIRRPYPHTALAASLLIWLGTNVIYYLVAEPSMAHMVSLFAVALLLHVWLRARSTFDARNCLAIGLAGGLVGVVRQPDAALLALPLLDVLLRPGRMWPRVERLAALSAGFAIVFSVQMVTWRVLNGSYLSSGYFHNPEQGFYWLSPRLAGVLFSTEHGLFLWHPVLLFAAVGLLPLGRADRGLGALLLFGLLTQAYIIASWSVWSQGDAFGGRMFIGSLPLLAYGLAAYLQWVVERRVVAAAWVAGTLLVVWNALFFVQYRLGFIPMSGPYTLRQLTLGKFAMLAELARMAWALLAK